LRWTALVSGSQRFNALDPLVWEDAVVYGYMAIERSMVRYMTFLGHAGFSVEFQTLSSE